MCKLFVIDGNKQVKLVTLVEGDTKVPFTKATTRYCSILPWRYFGLMCRVFGNGPGDRGSISGRVIRKTLKMVLDADLLNIQHCKVWIKSKVEQSWE